MTTNCPSCGAPTVRPDQRFCGGCGAVLPAAPPPPAKPAPAAPPAEPPPAWDRPRPVNGPLFADEVADPGSATPPAPPVPPPPAPSAPPPAALPAYDVPPERATIPDSEGRDPRLDGPRPPVRRSRRPSRSAVLVAVLALVAAGLGVTGTVLLLSAGGDRGTARDAAGETDRPTERASEGGATPAGAESGTAPTEPTTTAPAASYVCWDGTEVAGRKQCTTDPTGRRGLHWVFPLSQAQDCRPVHPADRLIYLSCEVPVSSGNTVVVNYSEWPSWDAAHRHYIGLDVEGTLTWREDLLGWYIEARGDNPTYKAALLYEDAPFSVTVYGRTEADRQEGLAQLRVRPVADLRGASLG